MKYRLSQAISISRKVIAQRVKTSAGSKLVRQDFRRHSTASTLRRNGRNGPSLREARNARYLVGSGEKKKFLAIFSTAIVPIRILTVSFVDRFEDASFHSSIIYSFNYFIIYIVSRCLLMNVQLINVNPSIRYHRFPSSVIYSND